jgi:1A family penicillin-binding protein
MSIGGVFPRAARSLPRPRSFAGAFALLVILGTLGGGLWALYWFGRHALAIQRLRRGVGDTVFFSADGRPWFRLDEQRSDVALAQVAPRLRQAVVAVEDHRFYKHPGLDPIALGRAAWRDLRRGELAEGGSTLTQQLARTLFLTNRRTWGRKAKEAALALMLEQALTKDQILELYLNRVYLSGGVYGVDAMSRSLFGKRAADLTLAESALVAGLIRAPSNLSPWSNPEGAVRRSHVVLARMRQEGYIAPDAEQQARRTRLRITAHPRAADARAGYAKEYLRQLFREQVGDEHPPDWQVHTTFVPEIQRAAEEAVARGLRGLDVPGLQAALVALDPHTGDVLALVGGGNFAATPFNRAVRSRRQPGSAFKPFVYAAALQRGYSPVTVLSGLRQVVAGGREEWAPRNSGGEEADQQTLREALLESNNQAAVALQQRIGSGPVRRLAQDAGLRDLPDVPSLALGTGLVTPLDLTAGYAAFANGGFAVRPRAIVDALDEDGAVAFRIPSRAQRVLSEEAAFQTLTLLRDVVDRGTGASARALGLSFPAAGKTGTTDDFKDAWFVGFSSSIVAGVWVGFDQPASIGEEAYGARVALPLWVDFMRRAARTRPPQEFEPPAGLRERELCRMSYLRPVDGCPTYVEYFKEGDEVPSQRCPLHDGSFGQQAERAFDELLQAVERRLKNIFKRRKRLEEP